MTAGVQDLEQFGGLPGEDVSVVAGGLVALIVEQGEGAHQSVLP